MTVRTRTATVAGVSRGRRIAVVAIVVGVVVVGAFAAFVVSAARSINRTSADVAADLARDESGTLRRKLDAQVPQTLDPESIDRGVRLATGSNGAVVSVTTDQQQVDAVIAITRTGSASFIATQPAATATLCFRYTRPAGGFHFSVTELGSC